MSGGLRSVSGQELPLLQKQKLIHRIKCWHRASFFSPVAVMQILFCSSASIHHLIVSVHHLLLPSITLTAVTALLMPQVDHLTTLVITKWCWRAPITTTQRVSHLLSGYWFTQMMKTLRLSTLGAHCWSFVDSILKIIYSTLYTTCSTSPWRRAAASLYPEKTPFYCSANTLKADRLLKWPSYSFPEAVTISTYSQLTQMEKTLLWSSVVGLQTTRLSTWPSI